jgi:prevent-host-death family protein
MQEIGVRELKQRINEIVRRVREEHESFNVTYRGRVVATITPSEDPEARRREAKKVWAEMDRLAVEMSKKWPKGVSAAQAIAEDRRG